MNKLQQIKLIVKELGPSYVFHRGLYELKKKTGYIEKTQQDTSAAYVPIPKEQWMDLKSQFVITPREDYSFDKKPDEVLKTRIEKIKKGYYQFFNSEWKSLGTSYNWTKNPDSGYQYPLDHWSKLPSYSKTSGDIKYVWEKSRFGFITDFVRFDYHFDTDNSTFIFDTILDWIDKNPINYGPNYVCSQETSIRIFHWTIALEFYKNSLQLNQKDLDKILASIYGQVRHVEQNLSFSRKLVRNNHAISECLCLFVAGTIFPFFPNSSHRVKKGQRLLEKEILYQVYPDGSYIQHSHNYHRVAIQLFTWYLLLLRNTNVQPNQEIKNRLSQTLNFLINHIQPDGSLPNYGANDGALFFSLNSEEYRNFAPQLAAFCAALHQPIPFDNYSEDLKWYGLTAKREKNYLPTIARYDYTGYYRLTKGDLTVYVRAGNHPNRPSQADNLHLDIWYKNQNIFWDVGTYKYNTSDENIAFFWGTQGHNTVQLGNHNQMLKGARFLWHYWTKAVSTPVIEETDESIEFTATISCYRQIDSNIRHKRSVSIYDTEIQIVDEIINQPSEMEVHQLWHYNPEYHAMFSISSDAHFETIDSYASAHYGIKTASKMIKTSSSLSTIKTNISFK